MKQIAIASVCAVFAVGCGNWSNEDLEYLNAMPTKEQLSAKLPGVTKTTTPLTGEGTRRDGLGEVSKLYTDTKKASQDFNNLLEMLLGVLDAVRAYPPTTRGKDVRIWGPWEDKDKHPGFEVQVVMAKTSEGNFTYAIQFRKKGETDFFTVVEGVFKPTKVIQKGQGALKILASVIYTRLGGVDDWKDIDTIEMGYVTDMFPIQVAMAVKTKSGVALKTLEYGYQELANGNGRIGYSLKGTEDPNILQLDVLSAWTKEGAGFGVYTVAEGAYKGATHVECFNNDFKTVFVNETWPGGKVEGDQKQCVAVDGFPQ